MTGAAQGEALAAARALIAGATAYLLRVHWTPGEEAAALDELRRLARRCRAAGRPSRATVEGGRIGWVLDALRLVLAPAAGGDFNVAAAGRRDLAAVLEGIHRARCAELGGGT